MSTTTFSGPIVSTGGFTGALTGAVSATTVAATTSVTVTSASASALTVGLAGATNPALKIDASTASQAAGLSITGAATGGTVAVAAIDSGSNTNLTINGKGSGTIGIGSVSTGAVTITPATTVTGTLAATNAATVGTTLGVTGVLTPTGGIAAGGGFSVSPRSVAIGGLVPYVSTDFTDATPVNTEVYIGEIFVPANMTVTGVAVFNGTNVTDNIKVGLANSSGTVVATSASTAGSGADAYQLVPFTGTYAAKGPATYYVLSMYAASTSRYNAPPLGAFGASKQTSQVFGTGFTTITPPTTFTANLCNIASLY